jgi:hypothetical protein
MATFSDARRESTEAASRIQVGFYFCVHLGACYSGCGSKGFGFALISCGSGSSNFSNCESTSRSLMTKIGGKNLKRKFLFFSSNISICLSLDLRNGGPTYRRILYPHPALQNMEFLYFSPVLWAIFALLDPSTQINVDSEPKHHSFKIQVAGGIGTCDKIMLFGWPKNHLKKPTRKSIFEKL